MKENKRNIVINTQQNHTNKTWRKQNHNDVVQRRRAGCPEHLVGSINGREAAAAVDAHV
jgi:hypothetical protein